MILDSKSVLPGREIPVHHTKDGKDLSPDLRWDDVPEGTVTFAILCEDPDAPTGTFAHWIVYDIPGHMRELKEGLGKVAELENGAVQGTNDFGDIGWGGPKPPVGDAPHTYHFRMYALDRRLGLPPGASRNQLRAAMEGHILDEVDLPGVYARAATAI